ncbi:antibiotic biosynthesis monooxygenase [Parabacteroides sp. AF17-3]|uniref:cache domain-containing protein n=1 Tax=Parabacteroides sp. AF17-3 TaxID=2293113 RepID=UPI000EFDE305|nr:cache domain-containing protein [Parabacteroides sp. AF17-3]RKU67577.1 antibiotic biosynthesis monooxygenase [Parabacteroides sp. AF17-3]
MRAKTLLTAILIVSSINVFSQNRMETKKNVTPQMVVENVHKAAKLLKTQGETGLKIVSDPTSEFNTGDDYIFIIDVEKSLVVSNPRFPERTGGNIREHLDWNKEHYGVRLCEVAMQGGGWIEFVWPKPGTTEGVRKISYIYPIPGLRYTVCAGIYNESMAIDELNKMSNNIDVKSSKVAVLFEVKPKTECKDEYLRLGAALKTELVKIPGFISVERFASLNEEGKLLSLSVWENETAATNWRNQLNHRDSQKKGHNSLFEKYKISVAAVIREYTQNDRKQAPEDSNSFLEIQ